ncbi:ABC transporter ATP-binding protein [Chlorobium phaeobacteroides]|uniref:Oligopeptide/dipeptide ABC transporter, ATPase subunit n=1 Tax=Chlorobium phaeobacteroides (strain DSM 266 / SMG 266 / 2430) TaxID=290317 RepID=A1BDY4_CHLPD|nr:oligopeptide/dipeptide ABC transporter ATP-binding protein [Chlorobium phaeobacteroides]ABL64611.1 oligopeptide/dipeptide ABC transporter, ATPase subunit [Chlorobium phaeobacteroides DSM 266]MBV5326335.1 ATP-binding cassette domain-containing protein [Chlorobium sp.]
MKDQNQLVTARDVTVFFSLKKNGFFAKPYKVTAVNGVSFDIKRGETLGLVGESGCGKTTLGRAMIRLGHGVTGGHIEFNGRDISSMGKREFRALRKDIQMIFQDPFGSLNPRLTIGQMLAEVLKVHRLARGESARKRILELLDIVGLQKEYFNRYPHEFSGGQRQRIGIARALAVSPSFIICDEPVSALDVSIQSQIINLLKDLQKEFGLTYFFIAHDLSVVEYISDRVAVMYLGKIVEIADSRSLYEAPRHPYTEALLSAIPIPVPGGKKHRILLKGDQPGPLNIPSGCGFHPRCPKAMPECSIREPVLKSPQGEPDRLVSCLLYP